MLRRRWSRRSSAAADTTSTNMERPRHFGCTTPSGRLAEGGRGRLQRQCNSLGASASTDHRNQHRSHTVAPAHTLRMICAPRPPGQAPADAIWPNVVEARGARKSPSESQLASPTWSTVPRAPAARLRRRAPLSRHIEESEGDGRARDQSACGREPGAPADGGPLRRHCRPGLQPACVSTEKEQ